MQLTVRDIYKQFPNFNYNDMQWLMGKKEFNEGEAIPLGNLQRYKGGYAAELSVFCAKKLGETYLEDCAPDKKLELANNTGIQINNNDQDKTGNAMATGYIPLDVSVFDIAAKNYLS